MAFIIAQILGLFGAITIIVSTQMKDKKKYIACNLLAYIFFTTNMVLLQAYAGAINDFILMILTLISTKYEKKKFPVYLVVIFVIVLLIGNVITYSNIYSLLPAIASLAYLIILLIKDMKKIRKLNIIVRFCWMTYDFIVKAYSTFPLDVVSFILSIVALIRYDIIKKEEKNTI